VSSENNNIRNLYVALGVFCLVASLVYLVSSLVNVVSDASSDEGVAEHFVASTNERIEPVSKVHAGDTSIVIVRSAQEIVDGLCMNCHRSGALGAPKVGTKSDWTSRGRLSSMVKNAINGKGQMPARGGDGSLSDADIKKAVKYMLKKSGL